MLFSNSHKLAVIILTGVCAELEDNFDWAKYLMEGEDIDTGPYPETPVRNHHRHTFNTHAT